MPRRTERHQDKTAPPTSPPTGCGPTNSSTRCGPTSPPTGCGPTARTLAYYAENSRKFAGSTADVEFSAMQRKFESRLPPGAKVLDFGCGSGRDA